MEFYTFSVTSANGYESLIAKELEALGIARYSIGKGNVTFSGPSLPTIPLRKSLFPCGFPQIIRLIPDSAAGKLKTTVLI